MKSLNFRIIIPLVLVGITMAILGIYFFTINYPDAEWYIRIAQGHISESLQPFSGRVIHPLIVSAFSFLSGLDIHLSFWMVGIIILLLFMFMLSVFFSELSIMKPATVFALAFAPILFDISRHFYLAELFFALLLSLFFYFLKSKNYPISLVLLVVAFFTRPVQAVVLGLVLIGVSFYRSEKKLAYFTIVLVLISTFASFKVSTLGKVNAHHLDNFTYYVLQPVYWGVRSVFGIEWVTNTQVQYCQPNFQIHIPDWIPLGAIKSIGICDLNVDWPLMTTTYPLTAFGLLPLITFFFLRKNWRKIFKESEIWLSTAFIYGILIMFLAILVPNLRTISYGWPAFWLAGLFIIDKYVKQWPAHIKNRLGKIFIAFHMILGWYPFLLSINLLSNNQTLNYSLAIIVAIMCYYVFIVAYKKTIKNMQLDTNDKY